MSDKTNNSKETENFYFKIWWRQKQASSRPFKSLYNSHFKTRLCAKSKEFYVHENKNDFHLNGFALSLALKQRLKTTRKWPIEASVV